MSNYKKRLEKANDLLKLQGTKGSWDVNDYMQGLFNGMELIVATMENRKPKYKNAKTTKK